jgi:inosine/xanthosine triphosphatase
VTHSGRRPRPPHSLLALSRVRVGSQKAPKIEAVRSALEAFASGFKVEGVAVDSGVPEQPVGLDEIAAGARNRARRAFAASSVSCDLAFGIEDGLVEVMLDGTAEVFNIGVALVTDGRRESIGLSSGFAYPPDCTAPALAQRADIGTVFDRLWRDYEVAGAEVAGAEVASAEVASADIDDIETAKRAPVDTETTALSEPSGAGTGNIGKLTLGVLPRSEYGRHAVVCALVRFLHPSLYFDAETSGQRGFA